MTARMLLTFNAVVGRDPLPQIRELAGALALEVSETSEEAAARSRHIRSVQVSGDAKGINELERQLLRFPAITAKLVTE